MPDHKGYQGQQANNYKCAMNVLYNAFQRAVTLKKNEKISSETEETAS